MGLLADLQPGKENPILTALPNPHRAYTPPPKTDSLRMLFSPASFPHFLHSTYLRPLAGPVGPLTDSDMW